MFRSVFLSRHRRFRPGPLALLALLLTVVLAACGSSTEPADGEKQQAQGSAQGAFPVTIAHKYGETTIEQAPERVVTLGLSDQDAVLALGIKPVGAVDWFKERPYGKWPWTDAKWGSDRPEIVGARDKYDPEKIAALKPDVIIAQYSGMKKEQYETLSKIAPVVAQPPDFPAYAAPWQVMSKRIGKALGKEAEMNQLIEQADARYAEVRRQHPDWAKQTLVVADSFEPGIYSAFAKTDPKAIFFAEMGFQLSEQVGQLVESGKNVAKFGAERLGLLDVDRLIWVTSSTDANERIKAEPLYQKLDVVKQGRDLFVPYQNPDVGAAISFNTVLSIPYAIDKIVPMLEKGK